MSKMLVLRPFMVYFVQSQPCGQGARAFSYLSHSQLQPQDVNKICRVESSAAGSSILRVNGPKIRRQWGHHIEILRGGSWSLSTGASNHVNDPGSIDSSLMESMEKKIKEQLNADFVTVKDAYGDGRHVSIEVVASEFDGKSAVNRQRMVYKAIWEELQSTVHAVDQMITRTPSEAVANK